MNRRKFLHHTGLLGGIAAAGTTPQLALGMVSDMRENDMTRSRTAYRKLAETLLAVDQDYLSERRGVTSGKDLADGHRFLMHLLQQALDQQFEMNRDWPVLKRSVTPTLKLLGDNPDAIYHHAYIRGDRSYRVRGQRADAVYLSISVQTGAKSSYAAQIGAALNDDGMEFDEDGRFEVILGPGKLAQANAIQLPEDAVSITIRHYFEEERSAAADYERCLGLSIEPIDNDVPTPSFNDDTIAAGIERVAAYIEARSIDQPVEPDLSDVKWASTRPNHIPAPLKPGAMAYAAIDIAYSMSPFALADDEALLIRGRWPRCRFANLVLWNRYLQSFDYAHRRISLNRAQTVQRENGEFVIVIAHNDPGVPNWIDTCGNREGLMYWRFLLPEEEIQTPVAVVVKHTKLRDHEWISGS